MPELRQEIRGAWAISEALRSASARLINHIAQAAAVSTEQVRIMLRTIRTPTDEMIEAAEGHFPPEDVWQAMVDEAGRE